ncbi:MAG: RidA family protein [Lachnospiraceae bacterium]|nr:RidA family protein [Candidatus Equihabitans merdae]
MEIERMMTNKRWTGVLKCGNNLYLSGVTSNKEGIIEQTKECLQKIDERLAMGGSDKAHILRATIYLKDMSMFADMNSVWEAWTSEEIAPARACVTADMSDDWELIEIVVDAVVK